MALSRFKIAPPRFPIAPPRFPIAPPRFPIAPPRFPIALVACAVLAPCGRAPASAEPGGKVVHEAFYRVQSAAEGSIAEARWLRLTVPGDPGRRGASRWWECAVGLKDGSRFGVRILSERTPMTSTGSIGRVERYLYRAPDGEVLEYRDRDTGGAVLPAVDFERAFLPIATADAAFPDGFATAGGFLGHVLVRVQPFPASERVSFANPRVLNLRTDLLMGAQSQPCHDVEQGEGRPDRYRRRECSEPEIRGLIDAGINLFAVRSEADRWLISQPVFFHGDPVFPDWFYRGNYLPGPMFIDEPSVRFGWDEGIPRGDLWGPEQYSAALRHRVGRYFVSARRKIDVARAEGLLDLHFAPGPSWDTHYFSAWPTLEAGASAIIYEGRYRDRGFGWHPSMHYGREGLDGLRFADQLACTHGFLRGAARAFDADWGTSVYREGDPALFERAFANAYDMGARHLWFWVSQPDGGGGIGYDTLARLAEAVQRHAAAHPRTSARAATEAATLGIVFPRGYLYTPGSILGFGRDQVSPGGATYGEISSAALWEGVLASRAGIPFDFLTDDPRIDDLGYERLVRIRSDATVETTPAWPAPRDADGLRLSATPTDETPEAGPDVDAPTPGIDYTIPRVQGIVVDGEFDDWDAVPWIDLGDDVRAELQPQTLVINNAGGDEGLRERGPTYLGFEWRQLTTDLQREHALEDFYILGDRWIPPDPGVHEEKKGVVVTTVTPGSAAGLGGLRVGDVVDRIQGKRVHYAFQIHEALGWFRSLPELTFGITRGGHDRARSATDLRAEAAFALDDDRLCIAFRVTDDVHSQPAWGDQFHAGDSVQVGIDPVLGRGDNGYLDGDHEITFAMRDGRAVAWRTHGRQGRHRGAMEAVEVRIRRGDGVTLYEAAIPRLELMPFAPGIWPAIGMNLVVNDNDGADAVHRDARLELREGAMTRGKNGNRFAVFGCDRARDPAGENAADAAVFWRRRASVENGSFRIVAVARADAVPSTDTAAGVVITAALRSADTPGAPAATARHAVPVGPEPARWSVEAATDSPPGRYRLRIAVEDASGREITADELPVYVYQPTGGD